MTHLVTDLLPEVRRHVKSCPDITLIYALQRAIREFCRESEEYQQTLDLPLVNDLEVYRLNINTGDEVIRVKDVKYNDYPLQSQRPEDVWFTKTGDQPFIFIFEPPDLLMLKPVPHNVSGASNNAQTNAPVTQIPLVTQATQESPDVCLVRLVLQPADGSMNVPEVIYRTYREGIAAGAAAWCLTMQGEVWYNVQLAAMMRAKELYTQNEGKRKRLFGHNSRTIRARPRGFLYS